MRFFVLLDPGRFKVESSTAKVEGVLPREFFEKPQASGYHPLMICEQVNAPVLHFGLLSEDREKAEYLSIGQQFLKWQDRIEWKKPIAEALATLHTK